ncbi:MAG TPA: Mur ligase family protein [Candidatus Saccharimonadales bacterium]|nr:Mur ligase family protein [Candidatus Saccharimonadales bacterium]
MLELTNFTEAKQALMQYYTVDGKPLNRPYTLDKMRELLDVFDNPQNNLQVVHVAGTSGKTSTAYFAAALAAAAGLKTGLTVSPHVVEINDRVQINGLPLPEPLFCSELTEFLNIVQSQNLHPSYFELMMAFAFWEFNRQKVDCAVVEVGLGGLLDASNVIDRQDKVCVITDIGLDHTQVLGNTLGEIATQKAGIIGLKNTVFCYQQSAEVMRAFQAQAQTKQADLHVLTPDERAPETQGLSLFQQRNFTLALAAMQFACPKFGRPLTKKAIAQALLTEVPGRMETKIINGKIVIIDGAHNQQKINALIKSVVAKYPAKRIAALVAFVKQGEAGRRMSDGLAELRPYVDTLITTTFETAKDMTHKGVSPQEIAKLARSLNFQNVQVQPDSLRAFHLLLQQPEQVCLVVGSFYLLNDIRPLLHGQKRDII